MFTLTPAQRQVALLLAKGMTRQKIAVALGKSPKVVDEQRRHICKKLRLNGSGDWHVKLIRMAIQRKWT